MLKSQMDQQITRNESSTGNIKAELLIEISLQQERLINMSTTSIAADIKLQLRHIESLNCSILNLENQTQLLESYLRRIDHFTIIFLRFSASLLYHWVRAANGSALRVYCDTMLLRECGAGEWTRVKLNMANGS